MNKVRKPGTRDGEAEPAPPDAAELPLDPAVLQEQLRAAGRRKDEFISALAHELRNPLTPILNALHLLKTPRLSPTDQRLAHEMLERQAYQLLRMIDDLLDVSRGQQGRLLLHKERLELAPLVRAAVDQAQGVIQATGHRCPVDLPSEPVWIDADAKRLTQALANLLANAARATPRDGRIGLRVEALAAQVVIEVSDTGNGIAREMLPRIFEPFVQAQGPSGPGPGLGLGVALAKQLVELHGGTLTAHSDGPGCGSRFVMRLERKSAPAQSEASSSGVRRVLVVDDNRDAARIMSLVLTTMGHEVRATYDGGSALEIAGSFRPDVALLDLGLPQMDGCAVAEALRRQRGKDILLIALTGWSNESDRQRTHAAGFDHHLIKPVDTEMLRRLLGAPAARAA